MKFITRMLARRRAPQPEPTPAERLAATLKPCPEIRELVNRIAAKHYGPRQETKRHG